jgi:hypothetical protein
VQQLFACTVNTVLHSLAMDMLFSICLLLLLLLLPLSQQKAQTSFESQVYHEEMTVAEKEDLEVRKRRAEGTPCNKENFEAWKARFDQEMAQRKAELDAEEEKALSKKKGLASTDIAKSERVTGREYFSNKATNLEALELAAEQAENEEMDEDEMEDVNEELFQDDVDLDDLDFDDDEEDDDEELDI